MADIADNAVTIDMTSQTEFHQVPDQEKTINARTGKRCQEPFFVEPSFIQVTIIFQWCTILHTPHAIHVAHQGGYAMGRPRRISAGGIAYHVLNRASARSPIFLSPADYLAFENILGDARDRFEMRILAFCIMPNHWHMLLWPRKDNDLSKFTGWLTLTHTQRLHARRGSAGEGHVYQGRYKSFVVESDSHLLTVCRYVERNALRANLVERAEYWRWGSLWHRHYNQRTSSRLLDDWPVRFPDNWTVHVNQPQTAEELDALRNCVRRGQPFGSDTWMSNMVQRYSLQSTLRARGRPPGSEK